MYLTRTGIRLKSSTRASKEPHIGKMVTPPLGDKNRLRSSDRSSGHHRAQILESHIEQLLSVGMDCLPEVWNAGEGDGTRTRGLLRDRQASELKNVSGRRRRVYKLTTAGRKALERARAKVDELHDELHEEQPRTVSHLHEGETKRRNT
jgi:hypothetical protein